MASTPQKRKREESDKVYSQPADTGTGTHIMTQVTYAVQRLKEAEKPLSFAEIVSYLSLRDEGGRKNLATILRRHERVEWRLEPGNKSWDAGTFRFKPIHNIRSGTELLAYLQKQHTAQGLAVKDLKEGWSGAEAAIDKLEAEGRLLVTRNKKDNHARMIWPNDPSLTQRVDPEFQVVWHKVIFPKDVDLPAELEKANLKPTSGGSANRNRGPVAPKEKKQKKRRAGGRTTNLHMQGILRDYSGTKK